MGDQGRSHQVGSATHSTVSSSGQATGTTARQARTVSPFTLISQAPQLPPTQPVGIGVWASWAACNQSVPEATQVVVPLGQRMRIRLGSATPPPRIVQQGIQIHMLLKRISQAL